LPVKRKASTLWMSFLFFFTARRFFAVYVE